MRIQTFIPALLAAAILFAHSAFAQSVSATATSIADTFVTDGTYQGSGQSDSNFGGAGTLVVAGANSGNGTFESLIEFNLSAAETEFNTQFGVGNWTISSVTLTLASNSGTQGAVSNNAIFPHVNTGGVGFDWIPDNSWVEGNGNPGTASTTGGVTYNTFASVVTGSESLGTFTYTPPGNNVGETYNLDPTSDLLSEITSGTEVSLAAFPTDSTIGYLFNSRSFASNHPTLVVTAVPEPAVCASVLTGLCGLMLLRRRRHA